MVLEAGMHAETETELDRVVLVFVQARPAAHLVAAALLREFKCLLLESLADIAYLQGTVRDILSERDRLFQKLSEVDSLRPLPTQSNFILCEVVKGDAKSIHDRLHKQGISVRYFDAPRLKNSLRISVGKPEHTDALVAALKEIC